LEEGEIMKKFLSATMAVCVFAVVIAVSTRAQDPGASVRAKIPFDFIVRGKTLPAGTYEIRRITDEPIGLIITNVNHRRDEAIFRTDPVYSRNEPNHSLIVFHRYGDTYFLSEIVTAGEQTARELTPSHAEKLMQREMQMASNKTEPQTVTLATY